MNADRVLALHMVRLCVKHFDCPVIIKLRLVMRWWILVVPAFALAASPEFRLERTPVPGGAELLTVFGHLSAKAAAPDQEVPLVSVLRDTLGDDDPANDRLRS